MVRKVYFDFYIKYIVTLFNFNNTFILNKKFSDKKIEVILNYRFKQNN